MDPINARACSLEKVETGTNFLGSGISHIDGSPGGVWDGL